MEIKRLFLMGASALTIAGGAIAGQPLSLVVSLQYTMPENDPEKLKKIVTIPVERVMQKLDRVAQLNTSTSHGSVDVEIGFQGEATKQDLATVNTQIEMLNFGDEIAIISRAVELRPPRLSFDAVAEHPCPLSAKTGH